MSKEETVKKLVEAYRSEDLSEVYVPLSSGDKSFLELHKNFPYLETHYSPDYPDMDDILTARSINTFIRRDKERNNPIAGEDFASAGRTRNPKYNQDHGYMPDEDADVYFPHSVNEGFFGGYKWNPDVAHQFLNDLQDKAVKNNYYFEPMENNIVGRGLVFVEKGLKNADILHHIYWTHDGIFVMKPKFSIKTSIVTATGKHGTDFETHHDTHHDLLSALDQHFDYAKKQYKTINKKTVVNEAESGSTTAATPAAEPKKDTPAASSAPAKKEGMGRRLLKRAKGSIKRTAHKAAAGVVSRLYPHKTEAKRQLGIEDSHLYQSARHGLIEIKKKPGEIPDKKGRVKVLVRVHGKAYNSGNVKRGRNGEVINGDPDAQWEERLTHSSFSHEHTARIHFGKSESEHAIETGQTELEPVKSPSIYEAVEVPLDGDMRKALSTVGAWAQHSMANPRRNMTVMPRPIIPSIDPQTWENLSKHLSKYMNEEDDGITFNPLRKPKKQKPYESEEIRREKDRMSGAPVSEESYVVKYILKNTLKEGLTKPWNNYSKAVFQAQKMKDSLLYEDIQILKVYNEK